jgi:hypothetical protein
MAKHWPELKTRLVDDRWGELANCTKPQSQNHHITEVNDLFPCSSGTTKEAKYPIIIQV